MTSNWESGQMRVMSCLGRVLRSLSACASHLFVTHFCFVSHSVTKFLFSYSSSLSYGQLPLPALWPWIWPSLCVLAVTPQAVCMARCQHTTYWSNSDTQRWGYGSCTFPLFWVETKLFRLSKHPQCMQWALSTLGHCHESVFDYWKITFNNLNSYVVIMSI